METETEKLYKKMCRNWGNYSHRSKDYIKKELEKALYKELGKRTEKLNSYKDERRKK